jgi:hypothetical protein
VARQPEFGCLDSSRHSVGFYFFVRSEFIKLLKLRTNKKVLASQRGSMMYLRMGGLDREWCEGMLSWKKGSLPYSAQGVTNRWEFEMSPRVCRSCHRWYIAFTVSYAGLRVVLLGPSLAPAT